MSKSQLNYSYLQVFPWISSMDTAGAPGNISVDADEKITFFLQVI